jgi:GNAT superfamily N-acetyltransferase
MQFEIRLVRSEEWPRLKAIRLAGLADAPTAFGSTFAREAAFDDGEWQARAAMGAAGQTRATFVAERDSDFYGVASGLEEYPGPGSHTVVGMFVAPAARGQGVGDSLIAAIVAWARGRRAVNLGLWVTATNDPAIALYRRCGFVATGNREALPHTPSLEEIEMTLDLSQAVQTT